jgi:hypothetical protein
MRRPWLTGAVAPKTTKQINNLLFTSIYFYRQCYFCTFFQKAVAPAKAMWLQMFENFGALTLYRDIHHGGSSLQL